MGVLQSLPTFQRFADNLAAALTARVVLTARDGTLALVTTAAVVGLPAPDVPRYDEAQGCLVWPQGDVAVTDYGHMALRLPDGQTYTLWARGERQSVHLPAVATLLQQYLALAYQYQREVDSLAEQLLSTYEDINRFYQLADAFAAATDETQLATVLLTRALQSTRGQSGAVVLLDQGVPRLMRSSGDMSAPLTTQPVTLFPALEAVLQQGVVRNLSGQPGVEAEQPDRPTLIAPITIKRQPVGAVILQQPATPFDAADMKTVHSLGTHAGVFLQSLQQARRLVETARLQQHIELAETLQQQLLPGAAFHIAGMDIAAAYLASQQVGGDYYDVFDIAPHLVGAVVADVSGHSLASGLLMTAARSAVRLLMRQTLQPSAILGQLNETLYSDLDQTDRFLSIFLAIIDRQAQVVRYASAGHNPSLLYRHAVSDVVTLDATGFVIGFSPEADFEEHEMPFQAGDTLVLYTDGVVEARSPHGEFFGERRLCDCVRHIGQEQSRRIVQTILTAVQCHAAQHLSDDTTLLVLKLASDG